MKNKTRLLTLLSAVLLSACGTKQLPKSSLPEKLNKLPTTTTFVSNGPQLEYKDGKWQYIFYAGTKKLVSFDADELKNDGQFDITKTKAFEFEKDGKKQIVEAQLKLAGTNLTYGHYGFFEYKGEKCDKFTGECNEEKDLEPFFVGQQNKKGFNRPDVKTTFTGSTHAMLKTKKRNGYISGTATLEFAANSPKGDLTFNYNDKTIKTVKAKGIDFEHLNTNVDEWYVNGKKMESGDGEGDLKAGMFDNKEVIGTYELKSKYESFTLKGGFGLTKK